jgi:hypothetical protein
MIPALIIWLYKKYAKPAISNYQHRTSKEKLQKLYRKAALLIFLPTLLSAQEKTSTYNISHNGDVIGQLQFYQKINGQDTFLKMNSKVQTRFIFGIDVRTSDQAHFENGKLISSNVYRTVNGKEKENKKTNLINNNYQLSSGSKMRQFNKVISYNMMMLYYREPISQSQVYSDNFQQFIAIKRMGNHTYRIDLPDGNYNDYHFQNGICTMVIIHHSMYTIKMELTGSTLA